MDYLIPIIITLSITLFSYGPLLVKNINQTNESRKDIEKLRLQVIELKKDLVKYSAVASKLSSADNTQLILEMENLKLLVGENKSLLQDVDGLIAKDPKKLLALERVNDKLTNVMTDISQIKSDVSKNDDRIFSGLSYWLTILLFVVTLVLSVIVKVLLPKRDEKANKKNK